MKIYIVKKLSSKNNSEYFLSYIDFGYRTVNIGYDISLAVELSGLSYPEVAKFELDKPYYIGFVSNKEVK